MAEYKSALPFFFLLQGPLQMPEHSWHVDSSEHITEGESTAPLPEPNTALSSWLQTYSREVQKGMLSLKRTISPMKISGA